LLGIEVIISTNKLLFADLQQCYEKGGKGMGKAFLTMAAYLKCYSPYIYNLKSSQELINELIVKNPKFNKFITEAAKDPRCKGFFLQIKILFLFLRL
jgi:hypothetical protein